MVKEVTSIIVTLSHMLSSKYLRSLDIILHLLIEYKDLKISANQSKTSFAEYLEAYA